VRDGKAATLPPAGGPRPRERGRNGRRRARITAPRCRAPTPRLSAADHARQVLLLLPKPARGRDHAPRAPANGRPPPARPRAGADGPALARVAADPPRPGPAGGRGKVGEAGRGSEWPAAPRTRGPWGRSPTRSRYSRDHERKGGARGAARPPASPAHVRTGRRDRTIPPYAHTDGAERSTRPTGATATHAAAAGPPLRLKLFQPYIIKIIPPSSYVYPFVIHMRHLVPAAAPGESTSSRERGSFRHVWLGGENFFTKTFYS